MGSLAFDGLFCGTDTVAYQVISMLRAMGLRVPEDVQVIGFDGIRMVRRLGLRLFHHRTARSRHRRSVCEHDSFPDFKGLPSLICLPVTYADGGTTLPLKQP